MKNDQDNQEQKPTDLQMPLATGPKKSKNRNILIIVCAVLIAAVAGAIFVFMSQDKDSKNNSEQQAESQQIKNLAISFESPEGWTTSNFDEVTSGSFYGTKFINEKSDEQLTLAYTDGGGRGSGCGEAFAASLSPHGAANKCSTYEITKTEKISSQLPLEDGKKDDVFISWVRFTQAGAINSQYFVTLVNQKILTDHFEQVGSSYVSYDFLTSDQTLSFNPSGKYPNLVNPTIGIEQSYFEDPNTLKLVGLYKSLVFED